MKVGVCGWSCDFHMAASIRCEINQLLVGHYYDWFLPHMFNIVSKVLFISLQEMCF